MGSTEFFAQVIKGLGILFFTMAELCRNPPFGAILIYPSLLLISSITMIFGIISRFSRANL
jgi:hypothetical protein